jgi:glycosyl transferase family 25
MSMIDTMSSGLPPVFLINMARDTERRRQMTERLNAIGLPFTVFEAVDGSKLDLADCRYYDGQKRRRYFGRDMTKGEVGVLMSHRAIMQRMVDENIPAAVILEDDVTFEPDFPDVLRALMASGRRWDIVRFLGSPKIYRLGRRLIAPLCGRYWLARIPGTHGGAHAYLLTQRAAKVLLAHTEPAWVPIDTLQGRCWSTGLESLVVHPCPLATDPAAGSTIEDKRFDKTLQIDGLDRALYPLRRFLLKLGETLGKRAVYWGSWWRDGRGGTRKN